MINNNNKHNQKIEIIIGTGIAGLSYAYYAKKNDKSQNILLLEQSDRIGGRIGTEYFNDTEVVIAAGVGRFDKDKYLKQLMTELEIPIQTFESKHFYSSKISNSDIIFPLDKIWRILKREFRENPPKDLSMNFRDFAISVLGKNIYDSWKTAIGYTDYEHADIKETIKYYEMEDNLHNWKGINMPWNLLIERLVQKINKKNIFLNQNVISLNLIENNNLWEINCSNGNIFYAHNVVIASPINTIRKLIPKHLLPLYKGIEGQPFMLVYAKFTQDSALILKDYVHNFHIVPGILQKMIPYDKTKGIYLISYTDNANRNKMEKIIEDKEKICRLVEKTLGISPDSLEIKDIRVYNWTIGTHYFLPNHTPDKRKYKKMLNPLDNLKVIGEAVSYNHGWCEGALETVHDSFIS